MEKSGSLFGVITKRVSLIYASGGDDMVRLYRKRGGRKAIPWGSVTFTGQEEKASLERRWRKGQVAHRDLGFPARRFQIVCFHFPL